MTDVAIGSGRHIPALDGLRGVAVLGVVAHHLGHLEGGYLGVDAFFVLSGFLITGLLLDELGRPVDRPAAIDLGRFWMRRAKRLLPAFFVVLGTVVVVERWVLDDGVSDATLRAESLSALAYVFNWQAIVNDVDYWATFEAVSPLRHMWSLAIEEQFYLVWPLVVAGVVWWAVRQRSTAARAQYGVAVVAVGLAVASVVAQFVLYEPGRSLRVYYGTDTRVAAILFGCVAAFVVRRMPAPSRDAQRWLGAAASMLVVPIAWAWIALDGTSATLYRGGMAAVGLATAIVIAVAAVSPASALTRVLSAEPLRWFGAVSYGLYLWHWPMIVWLTPERVDVRGWPLMVLRLAASLVLTVASYHLIEQPVRQARWSGRRTAALALPALIGFGALSFVATAGQASPSTQLAAGTRSTAPIPTRPPVTAEPPAIASDPRSDDSSAVADEPPISDPASTSTPASGASAPTVPAPTVPAAAAPAPAAAAPTRLMVVGDSGAYFLGESLVAAADADVLVLPRGEIGCGIVNIAGGAQTDDGAVLPDPEGCDAWPQRWAGDAELFQPDVSLIVVSWPGIGDRDLSTIGGTTAAHPCDDDFDRYYAERVELAIESAGSGGGRVVVATTPYYSGPGADGTFVERVDCLNRVLTMTATTHNADVLDLAAWTCPDGRCRLEVDGVPLRPDGLHFAGDGGLIASAWVLDELVGS